MYIMQTFEETLNTGILDVSKNQNLAHIQQVETGTFIPA